MQWNVQQLSLQTLKSSLMKLLQQQIQTNRIAFSLR